MGILMVCPESVEERVRNTISRQAAIDWGRDGAISLLVVYDKRSSDADYVSRQIRDKLVADSGLSHVLAIKVSVDANRLGNRAYLRTTNSIRLL